MDLLSGASGKTCPLIAHPKAVCHFGDAPTCLETTEFPTGMFYLLSKGPLAQSSAEADTLLRTLPSLCPSQVAPHTMKTSHFFLLLPSSSFLVLLPHITSTSNSLWYPLPPVGLNYTTASKQLRLLEAIPCMLRACLASCSSDLTSHKCGADPGDDSLTHRVLQGFSQLCKSSLAHNLASLDIDTSTL